jgi:[NiFe] hydrogenase diaphorase moiety large subunit
MAGNPDLIQRVIERRRSNPTHLLQILREIQEESDWISPEIADEVATRLAIPITRVHSVVQF